MLKWLRDTWEYLRYYRARRQTQRILHRASNNWMTIAATEPYVVETLEGLRGLTQPGLMDSKLIRVQGAFEVNSPIEIHTVGTVYDFEDAVFIGKKFPVLISRGYLNCFSGLFIDVEIPPGTELRPFDVIRPGEDPSDGCVIAGYAEIGSAFIDLQILNASEVFAHIAEVLGESSPCPSTETPSTEALLD